jgi:hypothetical protein
MTGPLCRRLYKKGWRRTTRKEAEDWLGRTFVVGVALTLIGNAATWRREKRLGRFQRRVAELEKQAAALEDRVETRTRDYYAQFRTELARV